MRDAGRRERMSARDRPPYGSSRGSSGAARLSRHVSTCTAKGSFSSTRPVSSIARPAYSRARVVAVWGRSPSGSSSPHTRTRRAGASAQPRSAAVSPPRASMQSRRRSGPRVAGGYAAARAERRSAASASPSARCRGAGTVAISHPPALVGEDRHRGDGLALTPFSPRRVRRAATGAANASARSLVSSGKRSSRFSAVWPSTRRTRRSALGDEPRIEVDVLAHRVVAHVLEAPARTTSAAPSAISPAAVVTAVRARARGFDGDARTVWGMPGSGATSRPRVRPWSPTSPLRRGRRRRSAPAVSSVSAESWRTALTPIHRRMSSRRGRISAPLSRGGPDTVDGDNLQRRSLAIGTDSTSSRPRGKRGRHSIAAWITFGGRRPGRRGLLEAHRSPASSFRRGKMVRLREGRRPGCHLLVAERLHGARTSSAHQLRRESRAWTRAGFAASIMASAENEQSCAGPEPARL